MKENALDPTQTAESKIRALYARLRSLNATGDNAAYQNALAELRKHQKAEAAEMEAFAKQRRNLPDDLDERMAAPDPTAIPDMDEFAECITKRRKWWVIRFEDGEFYGEKFDKGFDLSLFNDKKTAADEAIGVCEGANWPSYEIVEICWSVVN